MPNVVNNHRCRHSSEPVAFAVVEGVIETIVGGEFADEIDGLGIAEAAVEGNDVGVC